VAEVAEEMITQDQHQVEEPEVVEQVVVDQIQLQLDLV
tara:strand:+ start:300 stop:413 length:114 start_codon:yes stop_codon:yes gene_type:complete